VAEFYEGESEIDGDGGFADAAFAAGDGYEILYAGDGMAFGLWHGCWGHGLSFLRGRKKLEKRNSKNEIRKTRLATCASERIKRAKIETRTD
jgi:hypothetical protein